MVENERLADDIASVLRALTIVPRLNPHGFMARPGFLERCKKIEPDWVADSATARIFVDGFYGACRWNSWKVYTDRLADGLTLWLGFACRDLQWTEHCWCMLGERVVESTFSFHTYYGAQLTLEECLEFGQLFGTSDLLSREGLEVCTTQQGTRRVVPYDRDTHANSIGRERDSKTNDIKSVLG